MKSRITSSDRKLLLVVFVVLVVAGIALGRLFGMSAVPPFIAACLVVALWAQFEGVRRVSEEIAQLRQDASNDFRQIESLLSLFSALKPDLPLPPTRDHAASPDLLRHIVARMLAHPPRLVVELGSGTSSVFIAYCLKRLGGGRLVSIEHDLEFVGRTREMLAQHHLEEYASVIHCPLVELSLEGKTFAWYGVAGFDPGAPVDLLFIDGPPYHVHPLARYPAIPVMLPYLAPDAAVILDDAKRPEELRIARLWEKDFPFFSAQTLDSEKGALLLTRSASGSSDGATREFRED